MNFNIFLKPLNRKYLLVVPIIFIFWWIYLYFSGTSPLLVCLLGRHTPTINSENEMIIGSYPQRVNGFYYNKTGDVVGYMVFNGKGADFYYVKENILFGPFEGKEQDMVSGQLPIKITTGPDLCSHLIPTGWPCDLHYEDSYISTEGSRSHSKSGHTLATRGARGTFLFTLHNKQSEVLYDEKVVATETADCEYYEPIKDSALSDDGLHYAYLVRFKTLQDYNNSNYVVLDGKKTRVYHKEIDNLHFEDKNLVFNTISDDGRKLLRVSIPNK